MTGRLSRTDLYNQIAKLPPEERAIAAALALDAYGEITGGMIRRRGATRDVDKRRAYAGDPWRYMTDVVGIKLTNQQEAVLEKIEKEDRVLVPSATNMGKTFLLAAYALYRFDAVAALPSEEEDLEEQGALILLPGPDEKTVQNTIYKRMVMLAARAEVRGHLMPGVFRSERAVNWVVRPDWMVEPFSPPKKTGQEVAHTVSGRHHRNMIAVVEEGQAAEEALWLAIEGTCTGQGNKIFSTFNPTESRGPTYKRAHSDVRYKVIHLSALDHPNIKRRELVVGGAMSFQEIDARVRTQCKDLGRRRPNPKFRDFYYALAPENTPERGPRRDGVPGHPDAPVRTFRPSGIFQSQALGQWPTSSSTMLFDGVKLQESVERWASGTTPERPPDRVGGDLAYVGADNDDVFTAPAWGDDAARLIRRYLEAQAEDEGGEGAAVARLLEHDRIRVGELVQIPNGDGPEVGSAIVAAWPGCPHFVVDIGGPGTSAFDYMNRIAGVNVSGVSFGESAGEPSSLEDWYENVRAAMYCRLALLLNLGLVDLPNDLKLLEELRVVRTLYKSRMVARVLEEPRRMPSVLLIPKDEIKKLLGRSPDRADAVVLALFDPLSDTAPSPGVY